MEIKYPELKDRKLKTEDDRVFAYIVEYMNAVLSTLKNNQPTTVSFRENDVYFEDLVDVDSFIDYYLLTELMFNQDSTWGSIYMSKTKNGKLTIGPVWDFDWSMSNSFIAPYDRSYIDITDDLCIATLSKLFNNYLKKESNFDKICYRWNSIVSQFSTYLNDLKLYKEKILKVARYDANIWYNTNGMFQFDMQYNYVRLFLIDRINFFNIIFNDTYEAFIARI